MRTTFLLPLMAYSLTSLGACSASLCPNGWNETNTQACEASTDRMLELTTGLGLSGAYGYAGYRTTGTPPCGISSYQPYEGDLEVTAVLDDGSCDELDVRMTVATNDEGEWVIALPAGDYCVDGVQIRVDGGLWTEQWLQSY